MISINNLSKIYKKKKVLSNISFRMNNKIYGLLGPNGSGKTTLLRILAGLISATDGTISYWENNKKEIDFKQYRIGYLPQKFGAFKEITVLEQMEYFATLKNIPQSEQKKQIQSALEAVHLIDEQMKKCGKLSGGMIRRLGIAQAILGEPDCILLDEPTVGLDPEERLAFKNILRKLNKQFPIVLSTHIVEDIEAVCEEVLILNKGSLIFQGSLEKLAEKANGHVFVLSESIISTIGEECTIQKYMEVDGKKLVRILCDDIKKWNDDQITEVDATVEDGYMYLLKFGDKNENR